jgi:hypothetical protein
MGEASINLHSLHTTSMHPNIPEGFQMSSKLTLCNSYMCTQIVKCV